MKDIGEDSASDTEEGQDLSAENASLRARLDETIKEKDHLAYLAKDYLEIAKRLQAEFDNYKKRVSREKEDYIKCANEKVLADLLLVVDDLERAISTKCTPEEFRDGIGKIHDNISSLLNDYGLKEIPTSGGFDPKYHEALAVGEGDEGKILEVYQKGYFLGTKVLRFAKVKVAKSRGENNG